MKSKTKNVKSAYPVYDNAKKMLIAFKERYPEWKSSICFENFKCRGSFQCSNICLWIENIVLSDECNLYVKSKNIRDVGATQEFSDCLDFWDKLYVCEEIMNNIIETPLSENEYKNEDNYYNVREMAELANKTPNTIIKHIQQGRLWARKGKIRTKNFGYVSTIEDFNNYLKYGLTKGFDPDYPTNVSI
jgi:hypothetical protein